LYGLGLDDRQVVVRILNDEEKHQPKIGTEHLEYDAPVEEDDYESPDSTTSTQTLISDLADYLIGCPLGRWDIRCATGEKGPPEFTDPFASLPNCSPGMLQNAAGFSAQPSDVPDTYPLRITWSGILVDDNGHLDDIEQRIQDALAFMWPG